MKGLATVLGLAALVATNAARAQDAPCGLTSMTESIHPAYSPMAKAAHLAGVVVMLAEFGRDGAVRGVYVITGPDWLRETAVASVRTWRANPYPGPRTCPVAITFHLQHCDDKELALFVRKDVQHVTVNSGLCVETPSFSSSVASSRR